MSIAMFSRTFRYWLTDVQARMALAFPPVFDLDAEWLRDGDGLSTIDADEAARMSRRERIPSWSMGEWYVLVMLFTACAGDDAAFVLEADRRRRSFLHHGLYKTAVEPAWHEFVTFHWEAFPRCIAFLRAAARMRYIDAHGTIAYTFDGQTGMVECLADRKNNRFFLYFKDDVKGLVEQRLALRFPGRSERPDVL